MGLWAQAGGLRATGVPWANSMTAVYNVLLELQKRLHSGDRELVHRATYVGEGAGHAGCGRDEVHSQTKHDLAQADSANPYIYKHTLYDMRVTFVCML